MKPWLQVHRDDFIYVGLCRPVYTQIDLVLLSSRYVRGQPAFASVSNPSTHEGERILHVLTWELIWPMT